MLQNFRRRLSDYWYQLLGASYDQEYFQTDSPYWDDELAKQTRYYIYERYFANDIFKAVNRYASQYKQTNKHYKFIRSIYNPAERIVEEYVASIFGEHVDYEHLERGSVPIKTGDDRLRQDIADLLRRSNWNTEQTLYGRYAAKFADTYIKIIDDVDNNITYLETLDPRKVETLHKGDRGEIDYARITYDDLDTDTGLWTTYTEEYTLDYIALYKDVKPYAIGEVTGELVSERPNEYGFVPIEHGKFRDNGSLYGINSFFAQQQKIDEVNDIASLLNDNIRNTVQQLYHAKGVNKGGLATNIDEPSRDDIKIVYTRSDGEIKPITNALNIEGALAAIDSQLKEIEADTPVLRLHMLTDMSVVTEPSARSMYTSAINRILEVQSNLDTPLERAINKALAIDGYRNRNTRYSRDTYSITGYDYEIKPREVIKRSLAKLETIQALNILDVTKPQAPYIMTMLDVPKQQIDEIVSAGQQQQQQEQRREMVNAQMQRLNAMRQQPNNVEENTDVPVQPNE